MTQTQENEELGWCQYCKDLVNSDEDFVKKGDKVYHKICYEQKTDLKEGLKF